MKGALISKVDIPAPANIHPDEEFCFQLTVTPASLKKASPGNTHGWAKAKRCQNPHLRASI